MSDEAAWKLGGKRRPGYVIVRKSKGVGPTGDLKAGLDGVAGEWIKLNKVILVVVVQAVLMTYRPLEEIRPQRQG